jgi:hypothetical protein
LDYYAVSIVISYQRFGTTYQSHPQGSRIQQAVPKHRKEITTTHCIITQKSNIKTCIMNYQQTLPCVLIKQLGLCKMEKKHS